VRRVGEQRAERDDLRHTEPLGVVEQLTAEGAPPQVGLDPVDEHDVPFGTRQHRPGQPRCLPFDAAGDAVGEAYVRARDLEVVVVLGVDRGQRLGVPHQLQVLQRCAGRLPGVVPALERRDHHRLDEAGVRVLRFGFRVAFGHRTSVRRHGRL
jgi:hypothetical protein